MATPNCEEQQVFLQEPPKRQTYISVLLSHVLSMLCSLAAFVLGLIALILVYIHFSSPLYILSGIFYLILLVVLIIHAFISLFLRSFSMSTAGLILSIPSFIFCLLGGTCACFLMLIVISSIDSTCSAKRDDGDTYECDRETQSEVDTLLWIYGASFVAAGVGYIAALTANGSGMNLYPNASDSPNQLMITLPPFTVAPPFDVQGKVVNRTM